MELPVGVLNNGLQPPAREHTRKHRAGSRSDPAMDQVILCGCLRGMLAATPPHPVVAELTPVLTDRSAAERVGLPATASAVKAYTAANKPLGQVQRRVISAMSAAEDAALTAQIGTYTAASPAEHQPSGWNPNGGQVNVPATPLSRYCFVARRV
ncbi:hypothetical protein AB0L97_05835 [Nocardia sp. NPDC051911]|uniref:hypothetical protein n=1 Tax=Nocardia sp. NPDC051911 TaxID=3154648 RepID=UPI00342CA9D9